MWGQVSIVVGLLVVGLPAVSTNASAQTVRDAVKGHVDKNLDSPDDDNREGRESREGQSGRSDSRRRQGQDTSQTSNQESHGEGTPVTLELMDDPELSNPNGPTLPKRLLPQISSYLRLDLKFDSAYRGWLPQQYSSADVDVASYLTWSVAVRGKFFKYLTLHKGSYESNGLSSPRTQNAAVAAQIGKHVPKAAKVLAYLGFPFLKTWQPIIRYEARAFNTKATPKIPVCIVDYESSADLMDCPRSRDPLEMISSYETLVAAIRYSPSAESKSLIATKKSKYPPVYMGLGLLSYRKPYQVTIDGDTLEEFLFDGHFRGAGLAMGTSMGGGARRFFATIDMQIGVGEVALTRDFKLNEVTPDDWIIGYVQGNIHAGYRLVVWDGPPTIYFRPSVSAGGASFHFVNTRAEAGEDNSAPTLNWDFLWSARAALEITL